MCRSRLMVIAVVTVALTALAAAPPAFAWEVNDSEEPGSVIVFHKFIRGAFVDTQSGFTLPRTEIKINITCPKGAVCALFQNVRLRAHWVCPPGRENGSSQCPETDFDLLGTVNGTIVIDPENFGPTLTQIVPPPPCDRGYLIAWVIDYDTGTPVKFDALIGTAILRDSQTSARGYNALPIQASEWLATGDFIDTSDGLTFDGSDYRPITGKIFAPVEYTSTFPPVETHLTLLTLDVLSNRDNPVTDVGLNLYDQFENFASSSRDFRCWDEFSLNDLAGNPAQNHFGDGHVESTYAQQNGVPVTLVGIVEQFEGFTIEVPVEIPAQALPPIVINLPFPVSPILCPAFLPPGCTCRFNTSGALVGYTCNVTAPAQSLLEFAFGTRDTAHSMSHDSTPVSTTFVP